MKRETRVKSLGLLIVGAALMGAIPAHATVIYTAGSVSAAAGSSGDFFDVILQNTGASGVNIGAFSFGLTVGTANIVFTSATTATTNPYIFSGNSLFGPTISTTSGAQTLIASDTTANAANIVLGAGATLGIGRVFFNVAGITSAGPITVTLAAFPTTSLSDNVGGNVAFSGVNGTITVTAGAGVPEPSTFLLTLLGLPAFAFARKKLRRSA